MPRQAQDPQAKQMVEKYAEAIQQRSDITDEAKQAAIDRYAEKVGDVREFNDSLKESRQPPTRKRS